MDTYNPTTARDKLYGLIEDVNASHEPVTITGKKGDAVLMAREDYDAIQETMYLLSAGMGPILKRASEERGTTDELEW